MESCYLKNISKRKRYSIVRSCTIPNSLWGGNGVVAVVSKYSCENQGIQNFRLILQNDYNPLSNINNSNGLTRDWLEKWSVNHWKMYRMRHKIRHWRYRCKNSQNFCHFCHIMRFRSYISVNFIKFLKNKTCIYLRIIISNR